MRGWRERLTPIVKFGVEEACCEFVAACAFGLELIVEGPHVGGHFEGCRRGGEEEGNEGGFG